MKTVYIIFLAILTTCFCCKKEENETAYNSMQFKREGGGQLIFNIIPNIDYSSVNVKISEYNFKDTSLQLVIAKDLANSNAFSSLDKALNNQVNIKGNFRQSALATGTWAYVYLVSEDGSITEVTNSSLRDSLMLFEEVVRMKALEE